MHESAFRPGAQYTNLYGTSPDDYINSTFARWQIKSGMNPAFYKREANHLKPGESIKVIAINRATKNGKDREGIYCLKFCMSSRTGI